jgi:hypothetical protein
MLYLNTIKRLNCVSIRATQRDIMLYKNSHYFGAKYRREMRLIGFCSACDVQPINQNVGSQSCVLEKSVFSDLFLALDLDADVEPDGAGDGRLVCAFLQVVPHVHLAGQRAHLDDGLAEEVVRLPGQLLAQFGLEVVVLIPHAHLDAVGRVVTLAATAQTPHSQITAKLELSDSFFILIQLFGDFRLREGLNEIKEYCHNV